MKIQLIVCLISALNVLAAPALPHKEVCQIVEIERVEGRFIPQRGVRIYQLDDGSLVGEYVQYGERPFGGSSEFNARIKAALRQIPADVSDWNRYLEDCRVRIEKMRGRKLMVLDGWMTRIVVNFEGRKIDIAGYNCGAHVIDLAPDDKRLAALARLLDAVAIEVGRQKMAL
jgi:hypothetical protein